MKIKKIISFALTLVIILIMAGCDNKIATLFKPSPRSWKVISQINESFPKNISSFMNKDLGITVGYQGEIHYTKDGGKKWDRGTNSTLCLFGISIVDDKVAWACGNGSTVIKTLDGGASWNVASGFGEYEPNQPRFISFIDENTGWVATPGMFNYNGIDMRIGSTNDGGSNWNEVALPKDSADIAVISLRTKDNGYVLDGVGNLYITNDGGKNFTKQSINIKDINFYAYDTPIIALKFFNEKDALICYGNEERKLQIARSSDGGKTWVKETVPDVSSSALSLSPDGNILTITYLDGSIKVLSCN